MKTIFVLFMSLGIAATVRSQDKVIGGVVLLQPASGSPAKGTIIFNKTADGAKVLVDLEGLKPGKHGFHIHEKGDCSDPKAASAGAHFNPAKKHHGGVDTPERHAGDFGNIEADASGKAHVEVQLKGVKFDGADSIIGKSVIVHDKEDDLKTDPSGNSGDRIACGVIEPMQ
ncbi:MAG: superoxide dismutase, Cu-Zn family [Verrucomicrobiota bacterium]|jgi:Cu-Zn family superoxide dismutase